MGLAEASDLVTDYLSAFGEEANQAGRMADVLAYAQANSNTTTAGLGEAFKNCAVNANSFGLDIEQTTAVLGKLADQGLKGSEAGTALNAVFRDMSSKMKDGAIAIGDTNVKITDAQGNFRNMADIVADVSKATDGLSNSEKMVALQSTFTSDSIKAMGILMNTGSDAIAQFTDDLYSSEGAAKKMSDTMNNNLMGQLDELSSAVEALAISIGEALMPVIKAVVTQLNDLVNWFNNLSPSMQTTIVVIGGLVAAIGPALMIIGQMSIGLGALIGLFGKVKLAITALGVVLKTNLIGMLISANMLISTTIIPALTSLGTFITGTIIPALTATAVTIGTVTIPVWAVIAAIGALIGIGYLLIKNWDAVKAKCIEVWNNISTTVSTAWNNVLTWTTNTWNSITTYLSQVWQNIINFIQPAIDYIASIVSMCWNFVYATTTTIWNSILGILTSVWEFIKALINLALAGIELVITVVWNTILSVTTTIWNGIKSAIESVWNFLKPYITTAINAIKNIINTVWNGIKTVTTTVWNGIKTFLVSIWNGIKSFVSSSLNSVRSAVSSGWNSVKGVTSSIWNGIKSVISTVWGGIKSAVSVGVNTVRSVCSSVFSTLTNILTAPFKAAQRVISGILGGITGAINKITGSIKKVTNLFRSVDAPQFEQENIPVPTGYNEVDYSKVRFNYAKARETSISDVAAKEQSMTESFKAFSNDVKSNKVDNSDKFDYKGIMDKIGNITREIIVPVNIDGKEFAKVIAQYTDTENGNRINLTERGLVL